MHNRPHSARANETAGAGKIVVVVADLTKVKLSVGQLHQRGGVPLSNHMPLIAGSDIAVGNVDVVARDAGREVKMPSTELPGQ